MRDAMLKEEDLLLDQSDLVLGESTVQHQHLLLVTHPGEWKQSPLAGVGLDYWLNEERSGDMTAEVRRQFKADGMMVNSIGYEQGRLKIDAVYEE